MESIDLKELDKLSERFQNALKEFPKQRKWYHVQVGKEILEAVRRRIGGTGKVQGWQGAYVGSKGGYAAVRPKGEMFSDGYAVGYLTNAIENGHKIRMGKGKRTRIKKPYVNGRYFYRDSLPEAERIAIRKAEQLADKLCKVLGGET